MQKVTSIAALIVLFLGAHAAPAQKKLIILIRHAEKDVSATADEEDPPLLDVGSQRAQRLVKRIGKYRPGGIYSTDYIRTRATVEPLARKRRLQIQIYDAAKPADLVRALMESTTKRFVIVGHSNTISGLANLLIGKPLFKNLDDSEHSVIWLIRLRDGRFSKAEIIDY
jgi:2,3-bisphosphoglycerate-dependent phosphoglycerate mutase